MILKTSILALIFSVGCLKYVSGASYSKVFVKSGSEAVPLEYIQYEYGAPSVSVADPRIAQISAAPVGSVVPAPSVPNLVTACGTPCVYPGQTVAAVAPAAPNYVTYKSNIPVVVQKNEEPAVGYEYSYAVFDENTGDHKTQRELSDGSVVRGEYSLIQPDGYIREVQYIADDLTGFNAVVKNFLPANVGKKVEQIEKSPPAPPCIETTNEPLKSSGNHEEYNLCCHHHHHHHHRKPTNENKATSNADEKSEESSSEESSSEENSSEQSQEKLPAESQNKSDEPSKKDQQGKHSEALIETSTGSHDETSGEPLEAAPHEEQTQIKALEEIKTEPPHEALIETAPEEHTEAVVNEQLSGENNLTGANVLVPYNDILKCVQATVNGISEIPAANKSSPLTYIILNKPC